MSIQNRLQLIMRMNNLNASQFADKIGVQRSSVSHIISGRNKPSLDFIEKTLLHFPRVNADWLITGKVKEEVSTTPEVNQHDSKVQEESGVNYSKAPADNELELLKTAEIEKIIWFFTDGSYRVFENK